MAEFFILQQDRVTCLSSVHQNMYLEPAIAIQRYWNSGGFNPSMKKKIFKRLTTVAEYFA